MSAATTIQWTEATWNPVRGCSRVSEGCRNCYAERQAARFTGPGQPFREFVERSGAGPRWTGKVELVEKRLLDPLHWREPRVVFVNSMSDLFHEKLSVWEIDQVFAVMALAQHHTYQVLTKRGGRMRDYMQSSKTANHLAEALKLLPGPARIFPDPVPWPLPNVWLGVSVEDQPTADARIPELLRTPAAVRFVSYEPALAAVDFQAWLSRICPQCGQGYQERACGPTHAIVAKLRGLTGNRPDWIIVGGESGPGARPFDLEWARSTVRACKAASVPVFVKQMGANPRLGTCQESAGTFLKLNDPKGGNPAEWPADLRIREFPRFAVAHKTSYEGKR